jgi:hypothetical protein
MKDAVEIDPHLMNISGGKYLSKRKLSEKARHELELTNREYTLEEIIMNLWFELGEAIRNLLIGNYGSVHRSLRWILESAVFWTYLQIDTEQNAKEIFEEYLEESVDRKRYGYLSEHISDMNQIIFDEHLHIKEKFGKPSVKEMINSLESYKIKDDTTKDAQATNKTIGGIISELSYLYHEFSGMIHISLDALHETADIGEEYPYFMGYSYDSVKFNAALGKIWRVIDLMTSIFILTCSSFYGYNKPSDYLAKLKKSYNDKRHYQTRKFISFTRRQSRMSTIATFSRIT